MAEGLKINLGTLKDVSKNCKEDGQISDLTGYSQDKINKIQHKVLLMRGKTHREFHELLNDLEDEIRGLKNNIEDVSDDIDKYIDKMDDATPNDYDSEIFISSDFDNIKITSNAIEENFQNYTSNLVNYSISEGRPNISLDDITDDEKDSYENKVNVYNIYTDLLSNLTDTFMCDDYIDEIKEQTKKILDLYDQDYDMSDHIKDIGNVGGKIVLGLVVGAACAVAAEAIALVAIPTAVVAIALEGGIALTTNFVLTTRNDYRSGDSLGEALTDGADKGINSGFVTVATAGLANGVDLKGLKGMNLEDEVISVTSKIRLKDSVDDLVNNTSSAGKVLDALNSYGKELSVENLVKSSITTPVGNKIGDEMYQVDMSEILTDYPEDTDTGLLITYSFDEEGEIKIESLEQYNIG